jgi:hypothetical protein
LYLSNGPSRNKHCLGRDSPSVKLNFQCETQR